MCTIEPIKTIKQTIKRKEKSDRDLENSSCRECHETSETMRAPLTLNSHSTVWRVNSMTTQKTHWQLCSFSLTSLKFTFRGKHKAWSWRYFQETDSLHVWNCDGLHVRPPLLRVFITGNYLKVLLDNKTDIAMNFLPFDWTLGLTPMKQNTNWTESILSVLLVSEIC